MMQIFSLSLLYKIKKRNKFYLLKLFSFDLIKKKHTHTHIQNIISKEMILNKYFQSWYKIYFSFAI